MSQPDHITALDLHEPKALDEDIAVYYEKCEAKLGLVPNVIRAYAWNQKKLRNFIAFYNELMLGDSGLSRLEREMIAVVVSSANNCYYCQAAHGAAVRQYSEDPVLGELMVMNYRAANLEPRQRAMLDFAVKLTEQSHAITEADRQALRDNGFSDADIWDISEVAGFFNMSNRLASAVDMIPNPEYHAQAR